MSTAAAAVHATAHSTFLERLREFALPLAAISIIFVMLVPLPAAALDFLLALSMAASIIVFLSAVQIRRAVELSVFPTLLLLLTLFRLSLNIASSRRILLHGSEGTAPPARSLKPSASSWSAATTWSALCSFWPSLSTPFPASRWRSTPT
jgi:flagellar biosynthesis protein FlhA